MCNFFLRFFLKYVNEYIHTQTYLQVERAANNSFFNSFVYVCVRARACVRGREREIVCVFTYMYINKHIYVCMAGGNGGIH